MAIEFRCTTCQSLLRTGDDTAGRQARCPSCGTVLDIPNSSTATARDSVSGTSPVPPVLSTNPGYELRAEPTAPPLQAPPIPPQGAAQNPYQSPLASGYESEPWMHAAAAAGPIVPRRVTLSEIYHHGWAIFKPNALPLTGAVLLMMGVSIFLSLGLQIVQAIVNRGGNAAVIGIVAVSGFIVQQVVSVIITAGLYLYVIRVARGLPASFSLILGGAPYVLRLIGMNIVWGLAITPVVVVAMIPIGIGAFAFRGNSTAIAAISIGVGVVAGLAGFYIMFGLMLGMFFIIDYNMGLSDAVRSSWRTMNGNRLTFALLTLTFLPIALAGLLAFCVGFLFAIAFIFLLWVVAYLLMTSQPTADMRYAQA